MMKSLLFVLISLVSGAISGVVLAGMNLIVVEPFIDKAIGLETSKAVAAGESVDTNEQNSYRVWQKSGSFIAGSVLGMAFGSLLGIVYVFGRGYLPFSGDIKRAVFLSLVICLALFVIPFLKYPGNPPAVGNPDTIYLRESLYLGFLAVSAVSALGLGVLFYRFRGVPPYPHSHTTGLCRDNVQCVCFVPTQPRQNHHTDGLGEFFQNRERLNHGWVLGGSWCCFWIALAQS